MKPDPTRVLEHTMVALMGEIAPAVQPAYRQSSVSALGAMLLCVREEFDRAVARRVEENAAIRSLFVGGGRVIQEGSLRDRLLVAADETDPDLHVPALEARNQQLRALLVELHAAVEAVETPEARALDEAIWAELRAETDRRRLTLQAF